MFDIPELVLTGVPFDVEVSGAALATAPAGDTYRLRLGEFETEPLEATDGTLRVEGLLAERSGEVSVTLLRDGEVVVSAATRALAGFVSILPPLVAIVAALVFRSVIPALFLGVWIGTSAVAGLTAEGVGKGLLAVFQVHVLDAVANSDHAAIILFSFMIGGMVGIISKNGGMLGVVDIVIRGARNARKGQVATAALGVAIFFDDGGGNHSSIFFKCVYFATPEVNSKAH